MFAMLKDTLVMDNFIPKFTFTLGSFLQELFISLMEFFLCLFLFDRFD